MARSFEEYEASLPIPRDAMAPSLSAEEIAEITRLVFVPNEPIPSDLFFLFGTHTCPWNEVVRMFRQGLFPRVLITGAVGPTFFTEGKPLAHHMREHLLRAGLPEDALLMEDRSMNTLEDVVNAIPILEAHGVAPSSILFGAKAHHSGRCHLTLRRFYPELPLHAFTWPCEYGDVSVDAATWPLYEVARARVYGEYRRILTYSSRGDIAMPSAR